jgi:hypothetical protein
VLEKEFKYFVDNRSVLFKQFPDQYIVIKNQKVIGVYDNKIDAYFETQEHHELGSFLIQFCSLTPEAFTGDFTSHSMIA